MFSFQAMLGVADGLGVGLDGCFSWLGWVVLGPKLLVGLGFKKVTHVQLWTYVIVNRLTTVLTTGLPNTVDLASLSRPRGSISICLSCSANLSCRL